MSRFLLSFFVLIGIAHSATPTLQELQQRAEHGDAKAQSDLGWRYYLGKGVPRNRDLARQWLQRAAEQGDAHAAAELGWLYVVQSHADEPFASDPPDTDPESYRPVAESWLRRSAEAGDPFGALCLGDLVMRRPGSASDAEAVAWYRKAADGGKTSAQVALARAYAEGRGTSRDRAAALRWYRAAAESGSSEAAFRAGFAYEHGLGTAKDAAEAEHWYARARELRAEDRDDVREPMKELASLTLVRTDLGHGDARAIVRDLDGNLRTVVRGDNLGTQRGRVERIDADGIELSEMHPNGFGGWVEKTLRMPVEGDNK